MKYDEWINACNACADACDHCSVACLEETNIDKLSRCIRVDIDCAALCRLAAAMMARESEYASSICRLCAEVCDACAEECDKHQHTHCKECARACRKCAETCRRSMA